MVKWKEFTHFCCTSEDINNLAYAFLIKQCLHTVLLPQFSTIIKSLSSLAQQYQHVAMLSRTHGQPAVPTTFGKEMAMFAYRLHRHTKCLNNVAIQAKFNGAVGNFNAHRFLYPELDWQHITKTFVERFDVVYEPFSNQNESHDYIAELSHSLIRMHVVCLDAVQDLWQYISRDYLLLKKVETEVGSSTMPHKINPIDFENAEGNFGVANSLLEFFARKLCISRFQRDLSDSTVIRNIGSAFAYSFIALKSFEKGLSKIILNEKVVNEELNTHYEILAEPVQILLRSESVPHAYNMLKNMTRGVRSMTQNEYRNLIEKLRSQITSRAYESLCTLTPQKYIGDSAKLTDEMLSQVNCF
ncbi:adenylosuccinate lyase-like isoform X2 [Hylaeus volcanicus]|nr:adenylosuccinate lyase-like isoform X2 [Hylaeus volcanicus]